MNRFQSIFLVFFGGCWLAAVPAWADNTIQFSRPVDPELVNRANSFVRSAPDRPNAVGGTSAPSEIFNTSPTDDTPMTAPVLLIPQTASMKEAINRRNNWMWMTPEEVLGVPTVDKMLNTPESNEDSKLTQAEKFLARLDKQHAAEKSSLNPLPQQNSALLQNDSAPNPFVHHESQTLQDITPAESRPGLAKYLSQRFSEVSGSPADAGVIKADSPWATSFSQPNQLVPVPDQQAGMERFRAMMEPLSPPDRTPAIEGSFSAPNANIQPAPSFNPTGRSYEPLSQNIGRPQGIMPLPGLTTPYSAPAQPSALATLPPWLQSSPQSSGMPQRKF